MKEKKQIHPMIKPTPEQLRAAVGDFTPDIIAPNLNVLFCGINPSVYSAVVGHHFARPGNRFWRALHRGGFTPHQIAPENDAQLLDYGLGVTNVVARATVAAADLSNEELSAGAPLLIEKIETFAPTWLAILGIGAYRVAFEQPKAIIGPQTRAIGATKIWVLPNPSGLNAHYPPDALAEKFGELWAAIAADADGL